MSSRRTVVAAALALLAAPPPASAAPPTTAGASTIRLDQGRGAGYTRPRLAAEGCLADALSARPAAAGVDARVTFMVQRDGSLSGLAVRPPVGAAAEAAVREAFLACRWTPGLDPEGQPVVVEVTQPVDVRAGGAGAHRAAHAASEAGRPPPPVAEGDAVLRLDGAQAAGFRRPILQDPACLPAALQRHPAAAGLENKVKFAVLRDGSVGSFSFLAPVAPEVERAVVAAFESCPWRPAADPGGEPLAVWVVQPVKVAPLPPPPPEPQRQQPLFP